MSSFNVTLVVENADLMDQWFLVGQMLANVLLNKHDQPLRVSILPLKIAGKRTLGSQGPHVDFRIHVILIPMGVPV